MAMNVQADDHGDDPGLNTTINTTPLVDVMLVLLIIFLVTIPVIVKSVPLTLPTYRNIVTVTKPENISIFVTADESVFYNRDEKPTDMTTLRTNLVTALRQAVAAHKTLPEVHIRGDKNVRFEAVGRVILACQQAGIQKVGFITEPHKLDASSY